MGEAIGAEAAAEHVAPRFTRVMRATTSRLGVFTDPPIVCAAMAVVVLVSVILYNIGAIDRTNLPVVYAVIALPVVIAVGINASLRATPARHEPRSL